MKFVIFGASGDLAKRKLFPALSKLKLDNVEIIGYARSKYDNPFSEVLSEFYTYDSRFFEKVTYISGSYSDLTPLLPHISKETFFYLSIPPEIYKCVLHGLKDHEVLGVALEKPFGENIDSFGELSDFSVDKLLFIDHFLLKPLPVSWPVLVSKHENIKNVLNKEHVKSVDIIFKENLGAEGRAYFDKHGLVKDIVQNHISELMVISVEEPRSYSCHLQADERIHIFKSTRIKEEFSIFGQYNDYPKEMNSNSKTETFSVITLEIDTERWTDVPFITISGKGLDEKRTEIVYEFKEESFQKAADLIEKKEDFEVVHKKEIKKMQLICNIYPRNQIYLRVEFDRKVQEYILFDSDIINEIFTNKYGDYENHEIVFNSIINGTSFDCVQYCEASLLWKIFNNILTKEKDIFIYSKGSKMPKEAEELIQKIKEHYS